MAKKKVDWIQAIIKLDKENKGLLGDITREELDAFNVGQLKALLQDMEKDLADGDNPEVDASDGNKTAKSKFASMCGEVFDPKKSSECMVQCQKDFPEAWEACSEHFKTLEVGVSKSKKKPARGKTEWNHTNGTQAGLIDDFFFNGGVGTVPEVAEYANGKELRCLAHMKHLVFDLGIEILYNHRKVEEEKDGKKVTKQVKQYWWSDKDKRRKGDKLEGKSAYPAK